MYTETITFACSLYFLWSLFRWVKCVWFSTVQLPPGPKGYPILGNALDIPATAPWKTFQKWSQIYGDIMYLRTPVQDLIILNSAEVAFDLLEKRSEIYSDRPTFVMHELLCLDRIFALMRYTPEWRYQRREFHQFFQQREIAKYQPIQQSQCREFIRRVLDNPSNLGKHIRLLNTATILKIVHDMDVKDMEDEYVQSATEAVSSITMTSLPGNFWIEFFPFLRNIPGWVPGAYFQRFAKDRRPTFLKVLNRPFDEMKEKMSKGYTRESLTAQLLEKLETSSEDDVEKSTKEELMRNIAATAYIGAADTTTDAVQNFFIAMSLHPEVQQKAHAELDHVVGRERLPDFEDHESLIYIQAIVLETMRWMPVTPLIFPHRVTADDVYNGMRIPKGSIVYANAWSMLHNPEEYPEPERFNPDRFIRNGRLNPDVRDPYTVAFGFGRRICPGRWLADSSLFLVIANALHVFDVGALKSDGETYDPFGKTETSGMKMHYENIPCTVTPRFAAMECLVPV